MKKLLQTTILVIMIGFTNFTLAQNVIQGGSLDKIKYEKPDFSKVKSTHTAKYAGINAMAAKADCDVDTVMWPYAKSSNFEFITIGTGTGSLETSQYFDAPQDITVSGFVFYAFTATVASSTVTAELYLAGSDSFPTGAALASVVVNVDSAVGDGSLINVERSANFSSPVTVSAAYVLVVRTSADPVIIVTSSYSANDGGGEYLSSVKLSSGGWVRGDNLIVGSAPGKPFNADFIYTPIVTWSIMADFSVSPACLKGLGDVATFTNNSSPIIHNRMYSFFAAYGYGDLAYDWDFGDGDMAGNVKDTSHQYTTGPAPWTVTLTDSVRGWNNDICVADTSISIGLAPMADYVYSVVNNDVTFTDSSSNADTWAWDFGDGNNSSSQNPMHTYAAAGTYTVCLIASNSCTADTICDTVTVVCTPPTAGFTWTAPNTDYEAMFTNTSTGTSGEWAWDFGDASPVDSTNAPSHTYSANGKYNACLIASNACGRDTICDSVEVACVAPVAGFSWKTASLKAMFTDTSKGATSWSWDFGDANTSTVQNPSNLYAADGKYEVTLIVMNGCGTDTVADSVQVTCVAPTGGFSFTTDDWEATFTDTSMYADTVKWDFGDGNTSLLPNPMNTYTASGDYTVTQIVINACGSDTIIDTVTVSCGAIGAAFTYMDQGNLMVDFADSSTGSNNNSWSWDFGDANTSTNQNPSHTYAAGGTYNVCLIVASACDADTVCKSVKICPMPIAGFTFTTADTAMASFTDASTNATSWAWNFDDGNSSTVQNPSHKYTNVNGTYTVCLIATNSCGSDTICKSVTIACLMPVANFTITTGGGTQPNYGVTSNLSSGPITSWKWEDGDGGTSTSIWAPQLEYAIANGGSGLGTYNVCLTVTNSCGSDKLCKNFTFTAVGIEEIEHLVGTVYPNPSSSEIFVDLSTTANMDVTIYINDMLGKNVKAIKLDDINGNKLVKIDLNDIEAGIYLMNITDGKNVHTQQISVVK